MEIWILNLYSRNLLLNLALLNLYAALWDLNLTKLNFYAPLKKGHRLNILYNL